MKSVFLFCLLFVSPLFLFSQDMVGTWKMMVPDQSGGMVVMHSIIKADGTYQLDYEADGQIEFNGKYESEDDQVMFWTVDGDCNEKGNYHWKVEGNTMTLTLISDDCEGRSGPEGKMVFERI